MKPCLVDRCPNLAATGSRCPAHTREQDARRGTRAQRGYTAEYDRIRHGIVKAHPWCGACGATSDLTVDHIVPLIAGGSHDASNLRVLCRSCNSTKGAR